MERQDDSDDSPPRTVIFPLLADSGNRRVLREWLDGHEEYRAADPDTSLEEAQFDLCVVDYRELKRNATELKRLKEAISPRLLPILLLLPERRMDVIDEDAGEIADNVFATTIDEIVSLPIRQAELGWRIKALLRLQEQSEALEAQASELRRFKEAVDASGHAVYIANLDGEIEYVNPAFEEITGYSSSEAVGSTPEIMDSGEMSDAYIQNLWETILSGEVWEEEIRNQRKDGTVYTAYQTIAPIVTDGETCAFVAVQADITEQKQLRRDVKQSAAIIERLDDPIMMQDTDGEFRLLNEAVTEYAGLSKADLREADEMPFMDEQSARTIAENKETVLETEEPLQYEISPTFQRTDREPTFSTKRYPYYDPNGELAGTMAICRDVTGLKQRQMELRQYERAITEANDLIAAVDIDEEFLFANPQYCEYHDISPDEISSLSLTDVIGEEAYTTVAESIERTLNGESVQYRTTRTHPIRGERTLDVRYHPLRDDEDGVIGIVGVLRDVTENEEKTKQLRVVDQILRHNLRNSLQLIRGHAEQMGAQGDKQMSTLADTIIERSDDLLTTSHKSRAITEVLSETVDVGRIDIGETVSVVAESVAGSYPGAEIDVDVQDPGDVFATQRIDLALEELLENAVVHCDCGSSSVELRVERDESGVRIHVADEGTGMPEMDRDVLVSGRATGDLYHGSGLGLWLVYWIVRRSGGSISVEDREPRGTVVTIELSGAN
ncbi:PAS domain S-box protein [Natronoarchaeum sp. GCM10025703]